MDQAGIRELQAHDARAFPREVHDIRALSREHRYKTIVPSSRWTEDSNSHCLLVDLPEIRKREEEGGNIIWTAMEMLNKNKGIVMTAVVAFSLVLLVYRKFQSAGD